MLMMVLGGIIGICLGLWIEFTLLIVLFVLSMILCFNRKWKVEKVGLFLFVVFSFFIAIKIQIVQYDTKYTEGKITGEFQIVSAAEETEYYQKYLGKNEKGDLFFIYFPKGNAYAKGSRVQLEGEFVLPDVARNTGSFDYRRYLNSQKIYGSIFVKKNYLSELQHFHLIYWLQDEIEKTFQRLFPQNEMGLVLGMMIGETKDISEDVLRSFQETGITHLVAVSGANVMYVLLFVQFLFQKICGKRKTYYLSFIFLIIFMLVSGCSSSVMRATIMSCMVLLANLFYEKSDTLNNLYLSAFALMVWNPLIVYDVGFILSFGGTLGIILLAKDFLKKFEKLGKISEILAVTCSAQIALIPIMAYYFNSIAILAFFTNLFVVPISGFITILGFFVFLISKIFFPMAILLSKPLYVLAHFVIWISQIFSQIPFATIQVITPNLLEMIFFYFSLFYFTEKFHFTSLIKINSKKCIGIVFSCFIIFEGFYYLFPRNSIELHMIDVGQGDAIAIETNHHLHILVDGGGSETYDVGENILLPYLLDQRIREIEAIFSSHSDADHLNGILTAVEKLKVKKVLIAKNALGYEALYELAKRRNTSIVEVAMGDVITIDDVIFRVIGPARNEGNEDVNAYSLILKMEYGGRSVLLTGDIDQEAEQKLPKTKADILKVGHHGSSSSSAMKFLDSVNPCIALISVGKNNKYGHPSSEVLKRLSKVRCNDLSNRYDGRNHNSYDEPGKNLGKNAIVAEHNILKQINSECINNGKGEKIFHGRRRN